MAGRLSALRVSRTLPPGFFIFKDSRYSFLLEAESTPGPVRPEGLDQFKKSTSSGIEPALGQVSSEYFGFPCQSSHQILHHHNHRGLAQ
jgi:hypothetical protein